MTNKQRLETLLDGGIPDVPPTWELVFQIQEEFFGMPPRRSIRQREYNSDEAIRDALRQYGWIGKPYIFSMSNCIFNGMPAESYKIMLDEYGRLCGQEQASRRV
jgi:hypothetical protein